MFGKCDPEVDDNGRELIEHGTTDFPMALYDEDVRFSNIDWHWHEEWEFIFDIDDEVTVTAGDEKILLKKGQGIFINSMILHGVFRTKEESNHFHSIVVHPRMLGSMESVFWQKYLYPFMNNKNAESILFDEEATYYNGVLYRLHRIFEVCLEQKECFEWEVQKDLAEIFLLMFRQVQPPDLTVSGRSIRDHERIKDMLSYIQKNFAEDIRAADIAGAASVSTSEALRCFKNTIRSTPAKYLLQYRLDHAARLLAETSLRVNEIAERSGFPDMSYFNKCFKKYKGMTPLHYRSRSKSPDRGETPEL